MTLVLDQVQFSLRLRWNYLASSLGSVWGRRWTPSASGSHLDQKMIWLPHKYNKNLGIGSHWPYVLTSGIYSCANHCSKKNETGCFSKIGWLIGFCQTYECLGHTSWLYIQGSFLGKGSITAVLVIKQGKPCVRQAHAYTISSVPRSLLYQEPNWTQWQRMGGGGGYFSKVPTIFP